MDIRELHDKMIEAYDELKDACNEYRETACQTKELERLFDQKKSKLYDDGMINGRNAEARDAQVIMFLNEDYEALMVSKAAEDLAYKRKEQAEIDVAKYRSILRIEELAIAVKGLLDD